MYDGLSGKAHERIAHILVAAVLSPHPFHDTPALTYAQTPRIARFPRSGLYDGTGIWTSKRLTSKYRVEP